MRVTRSAARVGVTVAVVGGLLAWAALPGSASESVAGSGPEIFAPRHLGVATVPPGFDDAVVFGGLESPTVMEFASNGLVFVGEKSGLIKRFDDLSDPTPTVVADLRTNVHDFWDRGLLGMALHPDFPTQSFIYVLYTLDAPIGGTPPVFNDDCDDPLGEGCVVGARLSRLKIRANGLAGPEKILIEEWCQQYPSHSIGTLAFGPDGALYAGGGDGASFGGTDYGQTGNVCGDPVNEGGALRSQDLRTVGDPVGYDGTILRVDLGSPSTPAIEASGLRNPFRFALKPGTDRIFVGDVGWNEWEELNRMSSGTGGAVENFGWPCYEGKPMQPDYNVLDLAICEDLYAEAGAVTRPVKSLSHGAGGCNGSNVFSGMEFYEGGTYPASYTGALFFADVVRGCLWSMEPKPNGDPDPATLGVFGTGLPIVDIKVGPAGDLFYVDLSGSIHRITYTAVPI